MQTTPKVIAHRGVPFLAPENTMAGFEKALELGADGIELDVHLTKDNEVVVCHDERVDRTTNGSGFIKDFTLAELRQLDAGAWYDDQFAGQRIPTLSEVFRLVAGSSVFVNIELKNGIIEYPGLAAKVMELVYEYSMTDRVLISSFNHYSLIEVREMEPSVPTGILYVAGIFRPWQYAGTVKAKALHPIYHSVSQDIVDKAKEAGLCINPWTVDEREALERMIKLGVSGIITNRTDLLVRMLREC